MLMMGIALMLGAAAAPQERVPCGDDRDFGHWLEIERKPARQGETLKLSPTRGVSYSWTDEPVHCTRSWKVSNPRAVKLAKDKRSVTIAPDATPGEIVTISYFTRGKRRSASIRIVGKEEVVLTGRWNERSVERCHADQPVREFELRDDGSFSVTYQPFESYKEYWGTYRFDSATGALELTPQDGNFVPQGMDLNGTARIEDGALVLDGFDLGGRTPTMRDGASACLYRFK